MRQIYVITIHPDLIDAYGRFGVLRAARSAGIAEVHGIDLRRFAVDKHGTVDGPPYGGGDGMVLRPEPLAKAVAAIEGKPRVIVPSPAGKRFTQADAERWSRMSEPMAFVCGRFGGIDQRFLDRYVDEEVSLGDFVVAGGELPALMMIEAMLRLLPGVLGHADSAAADSFGPLWQGGLEHPLYTRPPEFEGMKVPEVLLSGDHARIEAWRREEALRLTRVRRPDLLRDE